MAKLQKNPTPKPAARSQANTEQDRKDEANFMKWMIGITVLLLVVLYWVFA
jgi:hypothetical protein